MCLATYASRLSTLFWTATSNFVFAIVLSLAQLIFIYVCPDLIVGIYMSTLFIVNDILQIICGLLATVWSTSPSQSPEGSEASTSRKVVFSAEMVYHTSRATQNARELGSRTAINSVQGCP